MNKLVRNNLVKGLPSKSFENNHTCVACLKGKQHKASCKSKLVNSVSKPLYTLHMDLFGPTSVSSLNHKWYCLVVTEIFLAEEDNRTLIEAKQGPCLADAKSSCFRWSEEVTCFAIANLGLQVLQKKDGIFLSQDKYVVDILKKFGYTDIRQDIKFLMSVACARHQVTPKECHLHDVKRIFRYLKGHPKLGLWYPKESPFDLVAYSDSDYGGANQIENLPQKIVSGVSFWEGRLISWQCQMKQTSLWPIHKLRLWYVDAESGCGQCFGIQKSLC
ncbi:hypothetical protein Tco_1131390 [Tanacetum coccineum]